MTLEWTKNAEQQFYAYELWRDTRPGIRRPAKQAGQVTSKLVHKSTSTNEPGQAGQLCTRVTDEGTGIGMAGFPAPPLEPSTTYYYRVFTVGISGESAGSNEVMVTTKGLHPRLQESNALSVTAGPAGTVVELRGTSFVAGMTATFGGKPVVVTYVSATRATIVVPTFGNPAAVNVQHDVVIFDPVSQLFDVLVGGFMLTA